MKKILKIISVVIFISLIVSSCTLKKAYKSLEVYNYFDAKRKFEKLENRKVVPANYGLSIIYQRNDNPFYNLDSAIVKIVKAVDNYSQLKENQKEKYNTLGVDSLSIIKQRNLISNLFFERAIETNSIYGFQDFINKNKWSTDITKAKFFRDSLILQEINIKGLAIDYDKFLKTHPNSFYKEKVAVLYQKSFYLESTKGNGIEDYIYYLKTKPNGMFVDNAHNKIFELSTLNKTENEYYQFILDYPLNININKSWLLVYDRYLENEFSKKSLRAFNNKYPDFPFKSMLNIELDLIDVELLKFKKNHKWGFVSENSKFIIDNEYDFVENFNEGLAVVSMNEKIGYITKSGDVKIKPKFDDGFTFKNGFSVIELNGFFGLINRTGDIVISTVYDDLGNVNEGLCYFEKDNKFGYMNPKGVVVIFPLYEEANNFNNGLAIVKKDNLYGLIDKNGSTKVAYQFERIERISEDCYAVLNNGFWGIINNNGENILNLEYDFIGTKKEEVLIVEKDNQFNYWDIKTNQFITPSWFETYSEYKELAKFSSGTSKVKTIKGFNFINLKGEFILLDFYDDLGSYANNIAFKKNNGWGYVNLNNVVTVLPNYSKTKSFNLGGGVVNINGGIGIVDSTGEILVPLFFDEIKVITDSVVIVMKNDKYGILSTNNDTILNVKYKLIEPYSNSIVKISGDGFLNYYNHDSKQWLIKRD